MNEQWGLFARDVVSMLDVVPDSSCTDDGLVCSLSALVDYLEPFTAIVSACVVLGVVLAVSFSVVVARRERARPARPERRLRVLSGPVHTDGVWVRLVEDERGRRVVEVLDRGTWRATTRDLMPLTLDVPVR